MRRYLLFLLLLGMSMIMWGDDVMPAIDLSGLPQPTTAVSLRYWFDEDVSSAKTTTTLNGATTIDASSLVEGVHVVHYQIIDSKGIAGIPFCKFFIKFNKSAKAKSLRYWFDEDVNSAQTTTTMSGISTIDASSLVEGIHMLHYQIVDENSTFGVPVSKMFFKINAKPSVSVKSLRYWFDDDMKNAKTTTTLSGATIIDASSLTEGIHVLYYQTVDNNGILGAPVSKMFFKINDKPAIIAKSLRYWFDDDTEVVETDLVEVVSVATNRLKTSGTHELHFQLVTDQGEVTPASTVSFEYVISGDVNGDGLVNVTDIVATVNYIMEKPSDGFNEDAADLNGDGEINVTDIVKMVSIIMSGDGASSRRAAAISSNLVISGHNIQLRNAENFIAAQFDINLSDGQTISNIVLNGSSNHDLHWKMIDATTCRVIVYSMKNEAFRANNIALFNVIMTGSLEDASICNDLLIDADGTTGIDNVRDKMSEKRDDHYYDLNGRMMKTPRKGIYILNGRKVVIK